MLRKTTTNKWYRSIVNMLPGTIGGILWLLKVLQHAQFSYLGHCVDQLVAVRFLLPQGFSFFKKKVQAKPIFKFFSLYFWKKLFFKLILQLKSEYLCHVWEKLAEYF